MVFTGFRRSECVRSRKRAMAQATNYYRTVSARVFRLATVIFNWCAEKRGCVTRATSRSSSATLKLFLARNPNDVISRPFARHFVLLPPPLPRVKQGEGLLTEMSDRAPDYHVFPPPSLLSLFPPSRLVAFQSKLNFRKTRVLSAG